MARLWSSLLALSLIAGTPHAEASPVLDTSDRHAINLALRAIKMTEHDLSFSKTNAESELVLPAARTCLQQPLVLPRHAAETMTGLRGVTNLVGLVPQTGKTLRFAQNDKSDVVARAVQRISDAAVAVKSSLPKPDRAAFDAFAIDALQQDDPTALDRQDTELAHAILNASDRFDRDALMSAFAALAKAVDDAATELRANKFAEAFETSTNTTVGKIIVGGVGRNVYTNEAFLIIDAGGDDVYENSAGGANGLTGRPISIVIDLAGNDRYTARQDIAQGAGVFGIGILVDCAGDDVYEAKHHSQGTGWFGCGLLADYDGTDTFVADTFAQGAAQFGAGILWQRAGDSSYRASQMAQGFGGTQATGLLLDAGGDDAYFAGGKHACGWLPGQFFSLAQGFGYGMRPFAGGGTGILCDLAGNDRYTADVYGQGASYWYAVGLLLDAAGNDAYEAHQYCQGAGIHLSSGALVDWDGDDTYTAGHIGQGAAHDYSVGMLVDRAGNDSYSGDTTAQGAAINNSFALLLDHAGDDSYTGTDPKQSQAAGHDGDKREYGSIALLLDLAGKDSYSQGHPNNTLWLKPWYGAGLDAETVEQAAGLPNPAIAAGAPSALQSGRRLHSIAPVDPSHPIERLLRVATSDRPDAGTAWDDLKAQGTNALAYLVTRLDSPNVLVRAKTEDLVDILGTNSIPVLAAGLAAAKNDDVARVACYFLAQFNEQARAATPQVAPLLERDKTRATALYALGHFRAPQVFAPALRYLRDGPELVRLRAAQALGRLAGEMPRAQLARLVIPALLRALDDELWDVRYAAQDALVAAGKTSVEPLHNAFAKASRRARPHMIEALAKLGDTRALTLATREYDRDDPLVRAAVENELTRLLDAAAKSQPQPPR